MKNIAQTLVSAGIVQTNFKNPFVWTSGIKSPIYCDCRELISLPEARNTIVEGFLNEIKQHNLPIDFVAGTATAGIPWAAFVAERLNVPMLYVRSKPKGHGAGKMVEGRGQNHQNIVVIEDAFSTGNSSIKSAEALRNELEAKVSHVLGIFTWNQKLVNANSKKSGLNMVPLTNFDEIIEALVETGKISDTEKDELVRFHQNPSDWWKE
ncbi:orotate phosphoribosyltransferase [bacterium DOLZORAL124_38_8]|nr:MAG: orotate phosphoribosyltransferase [bacterium DOLZORAL124_38_8]